jgi:magnesium transporter
MADTPGGCDLDALIGDIDGVKQHAGFEQDKIRYLQQSVMTWLDVKQNQIVKVFTIITAVFLPPTPTTCKTCSGCTLTSARPPVASCSASE